MTINLQAKRHKFTSLNSATSTSHIASAPTLFLFNETISFFLFSSLLNASVIRNIKPSRQVQTELLDNLLAALLLEFCPLPRHLLAMWYLGTKNMQVREPKSMTYGEPY